MDKDVQLNITDQGKPTYSFEDTPPSSDEKPTPDDNFGNKSDNDKNDSSDNRNLPAFPVPDRFPAPGRPALLL